MSDSVDREAVMEIILMPQNVSIIEQLEMLKKLPSAEPEIIRCKDCKNWDTTWTNDFSPNYHYCPMVDGVRKDDFYCADAERRTDE